MLKHHATLCLFGSESVSGLTCAFNIAASALSLIFPLLNFVSGDLTLTGSLAWSVRSD